VKNHGADGGQLSNQIAEANIDPGFPAKNILRLEF